MDGYVSMSKEMEAAKRRGDLDTIRLLVEQGDDPNAVDEDFSSLLDWASWRGQGDIVKTLLEKGADINVRGHEGETPLIRAAFRGHTEIVLLLIEKGADVNLVERGGWTALVWAQTKGYDQIATALLAAGALEDVSETPEEQERKREKHEKHARALEAARKEFASRSAVQAREASWVGAWANPIGPGTATYVFHADTVINCSNNSAREVAHIDDPGDGTLFYRLPNGKTTKIEKWSVSEDGRLLKLDYGNFVATFERL